MLSVLSLISAALAAAPPVPCEPLPEVVALLQEADVASADPRGGPRLAATVLRRALEAHPGDLFLQDALLAVRLGLPEDPTALAAERKGAGAGDPAAAYAEARAAAAAGAEEGVALARKALQAFPGFPWPHLVLADRLPRGSFKDPAAAAAAVRSFQRACPTALEGFQAAEKLTDAALARDSARALRPMLEARTDWRARRAFRTLWSLEAKAGRSQRPDWKARVAADVKRLRAVPGEPGRTLLKTIAEGAQISGDTATAAWAQGELDRRFADPGEQFMAAAMRFFAEQGAPDPGCMGDGAARDRYQASNRAYLAATADWVARWPELLFVWQERLDSAAKDPEVPPAEVERAAERVRALSARPGESRSALIKVAAAYVRRGVHLDEVPALVEQGMAGAEEGDRAFAIFIRDLPPDAQAPLAAGFGEGFWQGSAVRLDHALKAGKPDAAEEQVAAMRARLDQERAAARGPERQEQLDKREVALWQAAADVALARGRKADAAVFLARVDRRRGCDAAHASAPLQKAWKELGGTPDGLASLLEGERSQQGAQAAPSAWKDANRPVPAFTARDLGGRTWTAKDLRGKVVFAVVWATWCEPCKVEMPMVAKLHARYAGRKDVVVLSINVDSNPALVKPFLEQVRAEVPVLVGTDLADQLELSSALPSAFVADAGGVVRLTAPQGLPMNGEEQWLSLASEAIDRLSGR